MAGRAELRAFSDEVAEAVEALVGEGGSRLRDDALGLRGVYRARGDRSRELADALTTPEQALAYAASRMSSTHAAALDVLARAGAAIDAPSTVLDLGGGTGAAAIAAAQLWDDCRITVVDRSTAALDAGRAIADRLGAAIAERIAWRRGDMVARDDDRADLAVLSYSLVEADDADAVLVAAGRAAPVVAVIEPGSREGYANVLTSRRVLTDAARGILVPCPQDGSCPLEVGPDWCHFGVRVARTARQVRLKDGTRGFEDETFSYVVVGPPPTDRPEARIIARPRQGGRLVHLALCRSTGDVVRTAVPRSSPAYADARRVGWGDALDIVP